ncbi:replication protein A 32 kDa subunit [Temnothorax longispinosus]|uniref:replication protein A 32 kDa subunit n=1 Tax=Temnothorax longispinosus TaxID=300112 RepID=UPI003A99E8D9
MWNESSVGLGGGGFLDDSTQGDTSKKGPQSNEKTIVPVLIKHITSTTGDLQLAGRNVNIVSIVGILINIEQDTTKTSFTVQDDTGTITAVKWIEADKNPAEINCSMEVNTYVRVYGLIRTQNNQRHLLILRMLPLEDLNELTVHFMEVMYVILRAKKPAEERESILPTNNSLTDNTMSGMSREQIAVLEVVRSANEAECGIEKRDILVKVPKHIIPRVDEILEFLLCEGHIYTTSSEDFFKAT